MLRGDHVVLRARAESDVAVLHSELYDDVATRSRADSRPWQPISAGSAASPYAVTEPNNETACFSVAEIATDELVGEALLWGIDTHSRAANVGISLRPSFRGRGFGTDVVRVLCRYGFTTRGLHRLRLDTLADNAAMRCRRAGRVSCRGRAARGSLGGRKIRRLDGVRPSRNRIESVYGQPVGGSPTRRRAGRAHVALMFWGRRRPSLL